jgi:hypothetical protein
MAIQHDPLTGHFILRIHSDVIIGHASAAAVARALSEAVEQQLANDPDLRLLIREMVKDHISKMNLHEIVGEAVKKHLRAED